MIVPFVSVRPSAYLAILQQRKWETAGGDVDLSICVHSWMWTGGSQGVDETICGWNHVWLKLDVWLKHMCRWNIRKPTPYVAISWVRGQGHAMGLSFVVVFRDCLVFQRSGKDFCSPQSLSLWFTKIHKESVDITPPRLNPGWSTCWIF